MSELKNKFQPPSRVWLTEGQQEVAGSRHHLLSEEESSTSTSTSTGLNRSFASWKKSLSIALYVLYPILFILFSGIVLYAFSYPSFLSQIYSLFYQENIYFIFLFISFLIFIFGLIHILYIFQAKEYYDSQTSRKVITHTFAGYILLIISYFIITIAMIMIVVSNMILSENVKMGLRFIVGLLLFISMILLSVGLSATKEGKDEGSLRIASIMTPVFISINTLLITILPFLLENQNQRQNQNHNYNMYIPLQSKNPLSNGLQEATRILKNRS